MANTYNSRRFKDADDEKDRDAKRFWPVLFLQCRFCGGDAAKVNDIAVSYGVQVSDCLFRTSTGSAVDINEHILVYCKSGNVILHNVVRDEDRSIKMLFVVFFLRTHINEFSTWKQRHIS